jgi:hypothetical protein
LLPESTLELFDVLAQRTWELFCMLCEREVKRRIVKSHHPVMLSVELFDFFMTPCDLMQTLLFCSTALSRCEIVLYVN